MQYKKIAETSNRLGFTTLEDEVVLDGLLVSGKIPSWLSGTLIRNGPAMFKASQQKFNHWFDGLAMLHKFAFTDGKVIIFPLSAEFEVLHDDNLELPRMNYRKYNMKDYRFIYAVGTYSVGNFTNRLIKVDVKTRNSNVWTEKGCHPGEPIFVSRPDRVQEEDDGVILSVVLDSNKGNSFLLVLDAKSFGEIARAEVPNHIPFGFHGQYYGDIK